MGGGGEGGEEWGEKENERERRTETWTISCRDQQHGVDTILMKI